MVAFGDPTTVKILLRRDLTSEEDSAVEILLEQATSIIQGETRQTLLAVSDDVVNLAGNWGWTLELPERPIVDVTAVSIDGIVLAASSWRWAGGASIIGGRTPLGGGYPIVVNGPDIGDGSVPQLGSWGGPDRRVTVTYSHGYATNGEDGFPAVPAELDTIANQMVVDAIQTPGAHVRSESLGDASISYADRLNGALTLTDWARGVLRKYRP